MHVWAKGDLCLAPYSEDGENEEYFEARIDKITKLPNTSKTVAIVTFTDYEEDGQEAFDISKLRKPRTIQAAAKSTGTTDKEQPSDEEESSHRVQLFSQQQEKKRICMLYDDSDEDESSHLDKFLSKATSSSKTKSKSDKASKASKNAAVKSAKRPVADASHDAAPSLLSSPLTSDTSSPANKKVKSTESESTISPAGSEFSGFNDDDLERPKFRHVVGGEKVPLVLSPPDVTPVVQVPATINQYLRDYQRDGIKFLYNHFAEGKGAILADDMGLGKTVQVIGFIAAILGRSGTKTDVMKQVPRFIRQLSDPNISAEEDGPRKVFLIIGPASVLYNWVDEFETWGYFTVGKFHQNHKDETIADLHKNKLDVVVTTFETCRDNLDILNEFQWTAVIADEAHKIKGSKAEITVALKRLRCKRRYGLSGTVLQNDMKELWCVLDWANPKCLGTLYQFEAKYDRVISHGQKRDASKRELAMARKAKEEFGRLRAQWMLRRTKALIADQLPSKDLKVVYCQPTGFQVSVYKAILSHKLMKAVLTQSHPCPCDSGRSRGKCCFSIVRDDNDREYPIKSVTMTFMQLLMKVSNHVALLLPGHTDSPEQQLRAREICDVAFSEHPQFLEQTRTASFRTLSDPKYCGKMKVLCGLLSVFKKERSKVLIFSLSTRLLDILEQYIIGRGYEYRRLDGKTPNIRRTQLVREFNKDRSIFLFIASTKAGGIGLNLTGANVVVIFDPNWNPSHDLQAEDRAYRIGQGRDVRVFRLISSGTIEEIVYLRQIYKQQLDKVVVADENARRLFHGVHGDRKNTGELFGISNLFKLREGESTLTADILQRNEQTESGLKGFQVMNFIQPENKLENQEDKISVETDDKKQEKEEETSDDMYGADALLTALFDSDEESDKRQSPVKKKKRDLLDSISEDDSNSPQPSTSAGVRNAKKSRKRPKPKDLHDDSDDDSKNNGSPVKKNRKQPAAQDVMQSVNQSFECLDDVFENCGVVHTHDNRRIVGRSKAEDYMSRCAIQEVYELHQNSQEPAIHCDPVSSSDESDDFGPMLQPVKRNARVERTPVKAIQSTGRESPKPKQGKTKSPQKNITKKRQQSKGSPMKRVMVAKGCQFDTLSTEEDTDTEEREKDTQSQRRNSKAQMTNLKKKKRNCTEERKKEMKDQKRKSIAQMTDNSDTEEEENDMMNQKSRSKAEITDLKKKHRDVSVTSDVCSDLLGSSQSGVQTDDDNSVGTTQSIIDNLLGICDSTSNKGTKRKVLKPRQEKTVENRKAKNAPETKESQESSDSVGVKDTMAILDDIFGDEPSKVKAAPKRNRAKDMSIDISHAFD